ncbi:hypothetical protein QCA50_011036 [Cerrena zonata]|uniref:Outer spore wall protein RRT8 n=1 Tax=Cerrena zonata TaxID=2478898 RepID=A0AAW0G7F6_9APHY
MSTSQTEGLLQQLLQEATVVARLSGQAIISFAWLWPIRGVLYTLLHPHVILSVSRTLFTSLLTSAIIFTVLAFFTYLPQAAFLSIFTGPLGPILALLLVGAESVFLVTFFARALFLEPALSQVFDTTLVSRGQNSLVRDGKTKYASSTKKEGIEGALVRPFQALSRDGLMKYLLSLPLNFVPVIGTVAFLFINGQRGGPGWHTRYFQLKGWDSARRKRFIESRKAEYTAFGMATMLFTFIPLVGLVFSFTNTVGAALWAADIEARENLIESPRANAPNSPKTNEGDVRAKAE